MQRIQRTRSFISFFLLMLFFAQSAQAACVNCTTLDFDKKIEMNLILPMLQMSMKEKIGYIQSFNVEVYRVKDPEAETITLSFLPYASKEKFSSKFLKLFEEGVIGLYMTPTNLMYRVQEPTILLSEGADDWTVIHEFSHYLFDRARLMQDATQESEFVLRSQDSQEDFFEAKEVFNMFNGFRDEQHKKHLINSFVSYAKMQMLFVKTCEYEETTIEKFIRAIYTIHKPQGFLEEHFERSTRYIKSTSSKGHEMLGFILEDCDLWRQTLSLEKDKGLIRSLDKVCQSARTLKEEGHRVVKGLYLE